jgi:hypothetical protein
LKYFLDNNISYKFAKMLAALDCDVVALRESFSTDITDEKLLTQLAGRDIVFVTGDRMMLRRPQELQALKIAGISVLFLGPFWSKMGFWRQAEWWIRRWHLIDGFSRAAAKGTFAEVSQGGKCRPF